MNPKVEQYMREYDELKRTIIDSPLTDEEVAAEIIQRYPLWNIIFAEWLVRELRSAHREVTVARASADDSRSELAVHRAMYHSR